jgi:hypothetical protein
MELTTEQAAEKKRLDEMLRGKVPHDECRVYIASKLNQPHPDSQTWRGCIVCGTYHTMGHLCGCPISDLQKMLNGKMRFYTDD